MIIGCPSCNTKFAVDAQQLAEVENPRFHCSRCGHVFDVKDAESPGEDKAPEETAEKDADSIETETVESEASTQTDLFDSPQVPKDAPSDRFLMEDWAEVNESAADQRQGTERYSEDSDEEVEDEDEQLTLPETKGSYSAEDSFVSRFAVTEPADDDDFDDFPQVTADWPSGPANEPYEVAPFTTRSEQGATPGGKESASQREINIEEVGVDAVEEEDDIFSGTAQWSSLRDAEDLYEVEADSDETDLGAWQSEADDFDYLEDDNREESLAEEETYEAPEQYPASEYDTAESEYEEQAEEHDLIEESPFVSRLKGIASKDTAITKIEPFSDFSEEEEATSDDLFASSDAAQRHEPESFFDQWTSGEISSTDETDEIEEVLRPGAEKKSLRQTFSEVMLRRSDEESAKEQTNKVIELKESPALEKERAKRKAERRSAHHDRLLQDAIEHPDSAFPPPKQSVITGAGAIVLMWSVPLLLMGLFWFWGSSVAQTPEPLKQIFRLDSEYLPKSAPAGLALVDLSSEIIALDDGTKVMEVRGAIFNATVETFSEVKLEAKTYDEGNQVLSEELVSYNNGLMNAKLGALQLSAIKSLQAKQGASVVEITPNLKVPFRVILTDLTGEEKWFSARVYSVHPKA